MLSVQYAAVAERVRQQSFSRTSFSWIVTTLSIAYLLLQIPLLDRVPLVAVDEPWYANTADNFARGNGLINTNVGRRGGDQFFLYTIFVAGVFKALGTSLWTGRFCSVLIGLGALWGWFLVCRALKAGTAALIVTSTLFII